MSHTTTAAIGWSPKADAGRAGKDAAEGAKERLGRRLPIAAIVFGSSWFDQALLLQGVRSVIGRVPLVGASTAGEITAEGPTSHSCVVVLIASDALTCSAGMGEGMDRDARASGHEAAYTALQHVPAGPRRGFLMFSDGLFATAGDIVRGVQEALGTGSLILGGLAADDLRYAQTYQYFNDRVATRSVVGLLLGGDGQIGVGSEHGFAPISKPRRITRSRANVLYELDRQPATSVYEEYFGSGALQRLRQEGLTRQGIAYPLGVQSEMADRWILRNVVASREDGSLSCNGEIPEGCWLQLMIGSRELALAAARNAAQQAIQSLNRVACVLVLDSAVRRLLLGPRHAAMEIAAIRDIVGASTPLAGCYTYGEHTPIGPSAGHERTTTQTGSVLVVALGSEKP